MAEPIYELPEKYVKRGWRIEPDSTKGWVVAVNKDGRQGVSHYMTKHRGLKFVLREIDRMDAAANNTSDL